MIRKSIQLPLLPDDSKKGQNAGIRPHRIGGLLLKHQVVNNKHLYLNYGQSIAGVTLATGCAVRIVDIFEQNIKNKTQKTEQEAAILGAGINGLMTAVELLKRNPKIKLTIYADKFPVKGQNNHLKLTTSHIAPGFWFPYVSGYLDPEPSPQTISPQDYKSLSSQSYQLYLTNYINNPKYKKCVTICSIFDVNQNIGDEELKSQMPQELIDTFKVFELTVNGNIKKKCRYFETVKVDLAVFIALLQEEVKAKTTFVQRKFTKIDDITNLPQQHIFNCMGYNNKYVINDTKMLPFKGHLLQYENPNPSKFNFIFRSNFGKKLLTYYMHQSRIIIGLTKKVSDNLQIEKSETDDLTQRLRGVQKLYFSGRPKL